MFLQRADAGKALIHVLNHAHQCFSATLGVLGTRACQRDRFDSPSLSLRSSYMVPHAVDHEVVVEMPVLMMMMMMMMMVMMTMMMLLVMVMVMVMGMVLTMATAVVMVKMAYCWKRRQADPPTWTSPTYHGDSSSARGYSAVMDSSGKMWVFGGYTQLGSGSLISQRFVSHTCGTGKSSNCTRAEFNVSMPLLPGGPPNLDISVSQ